MKTPAACLASALLLALPLCAGVAIFCAVPQMQIKFDLKAADGAALKSEVISTIHALGAD